MDALSQNRGLFPVRLPADAPSTQFCKLPATQQNPLWGQASEPNGPQDRVTSGPLSERQGRYREALQGFNEVFSQLPESDRERLRNLYQQAQRPGVNAIDGTPTETSPSDAIGNFARSTSSAFLTNFSVSNAASALGDANRGLHCQRGFQPF